MDVKGSLGSIKETLVDSGKTAALELLPGGNTTATFLGKMLKSSNEKKIKAIHKHKAKNEENTVDEGEFKAAISLVDDQWSGGPFRAIAKFIRWVVPGGPSTDERHIKAIDEFKGLASMHDAGNFAVEAFKFTKDKIYKRISKKTGIFKRILNFLFGYENKKLKKDTVLNSYIEAAKAWANAIDLSHPGFVRHLEDYRDRIVNDDSLPRFIRSINTDKDGETLGSLLDSLVKKAKQQSNQPHSKAA